MSDELFPAPEIPPPYLDRLRRQLAASDQAIIDAETHADETGEAVPHELYRDRDLIKSRLWREEKRRTELR